MVKFFDDLCAGHSGGDLLHYPFVGYAFFFPCEFGISFLLCGDFLGGAHVDAFGVADAGLYLSGTAGYAVAVDAQFFFHGFESGLAAFGAQGAFHFGEGGEHGEHHLAHRGAVFDLVAVEGDELDAFFHCEVDEIEHVLNGSAEAVELAGVYYVAGL